MAIYNGFPPVTDPSWLGRTRKLLEFLVEPRDWKQLKGWCRRGALLRQSLAWLEHSKEAGTFVKTKVLYWVEADKLELFQEPAEDLAEPSDDSVEL